MTATRRWPVVLPDDARARRESGLSLIELLVALTVFALLSGGLVLLVESGLGLARNNRNRSIAANLASQEMDAVRQAKFTTLPLGLVTTTVPVNSVAYVVNRNSEWVNNNSAAGACDSSGTVPKVLRVSVDVSWPDMRGVPPARSSTVITPPVGSYDPNTGHIAVKVRNGDAAPLGGVPVRVVGPGVDRTVASTDALAASPGCAFFAFLPAGSYTVSLGLAGYVDRQGTATPTQTVGRGGRARPAPWRSTTTWPLRCSSRSRRRTAARPLNGVPITLGQHRVPARRARRRSPGAGLAPHDHEPVPVPRRLRGLGRRLRRRGSRGQERERHAVLARGAARAGAGLRARAHDH